MRRAIVRAQMAGAAEAGVRGLYEHRNKDEAAVKHAG